MPVPNKREFLARAFGRIGAAWISGANDRQAAAWTDCLDLSPDRRATDVDLYYDPVISATPESFRTQVAWLHNRVRLMTLNELIDQVERGSPWREPVMLLTFDDGYRDNFDMAVPILREQQGTGNLLYSVGIP